MRRWLQRAARRPAATASFLQLHALPPRHPPIHRSGFARDRPGLGRAVTCNSASAMLLSNPSQRPAAGSIPAQADARRGLLHERALVHHQGLEEVRRACCHCPAAMNPSVPLSPHAPSPHTVLSCSLFMYILQVSAFRHTVLRSAGAFEKSKIQEWPLDGVSDLVQVSSVAAHGW